MLTDCYSTEILWDLLYKIQIGNKTNIIKMANTIGNESMEKSWMRDGATSINIVVDLYFAWKLHSEGAFDYIWFTFVDLLNEINKYEEK